MPIKIWVLDKNGVRQMTKDEALRMAIEIMQRYLKETPLGNQPHMIAHKAEEAIQACKDALENLEKDPPISRNEQPAKEQLTDSQCDEFRRLSMSFNDMVRAIYKAGQEALEKPTTEQSSLVQEPKSPTILARLPNGTTASNVYEAYEAGLKEGKAETQEPVGYVVPDYEECCKAFNGKTLMSKEKTDLHKIPLYTTPPSREWVGLSDDEITGVWNSLTETQFDFDFARVIEAKLKEKNNG